MQLISIKHLQKTILAVLLFGTLTSSAPLASPKISDENAHNIRNLESISPKLDYWTKPDNAVAYKNCIRVATEFYSDECRGTNACRYNCKQFIDDLKNYEKELSEPDILRKVEQAIQTLEHLEIKMKNFSLNMLAA